MVKTLNFHPSLFLNEKQKLYNGQEFTNSGKLTKDNYKESVHYINFNIMMVLKIISKNIIWKYLSENETFLMWKDYYIVNNIDPIHITLC